MKQDEMPNRCVQDREELRRRAATTCAPSPIAKPAEPLSSQEKISRIAHHFKQIMEILGLDVTDSSLAESPERVAQMYVTEIFSGLDLDAFPDPSLFDTPSCTNTSSSAQGPIFLKVSFTSFCEHHFVPMVGHAYLGYVPKKRIMGFSKFSRIVRYFAKRPQVQERLTLQIADSLSLLLDTEDVAVSTHATHHCMTARGVEDRESSVTNQVLWGAFQKDPLLHQQFLQALINLR